MVLKRAAAIGLITICGWSASLLGQMNEKLTLSETGQQFYNASYSPDGKFITTTCSDNTIIIWNTERGTVHRTLAGLKKRPNSIVYSTDGIHLFSAGEDGLITTWDLGLVRKSDSTSGHTGPINALDISPDGSILVSGGDDKILRVWKITGEKLDLVWELKGHRKSITTLDFDPDGRTVVSGSADRFLMKWDVQNGTRMGEVKAHGGWVRVASYSPDGRYIASGGDDKLIQIWNSANLTPHKTLKGHTDWVQTLDYTNSGDHIVSGGHDQYIRVWEVDTEQMVGQSGKLEQIVLSVDASPLGNDIISSCLLSEELRIWAHRYETKTTTSSSATEAITLFSPVPEDGKVIHNSSNILIVGKAEAPDGIQTMLINRQRIELTESGIFQMEIDLLQGENQVEMVAVTNRGKMINNSFVIQCTDESASRTAEAQQGVEEGKYYALIIGVDDYKDEKITDLDFPIADADSLFHVLVDRYTFGEDDIRFMKNPSRTEIIIAMDELSKLVTERDNLLIFYAGHGHWDEKAGIGYWLPTDADRSNIANWFRNSTLRDFIGSIPSKHTLLIADACFSGSILKTRSFGSNNRRIEKLHELPSRKAMTSGNMKEVPDKSVFVRYLIQNLKQNQDKFLPAEELFSSFKPAVLNNSPNVPRYGTIQNVGDEGGDFIFVRK